MIALVKPDNRVASWFYERPDNWQFPDGWAVVETDFPFDPTVDPSCYEYTGETFVYHEPEPEPLQPTEVLRAIFAADPMSIEQLPDESLARMAPYMEPWAAGAAYERGNVREYDELPYRCEQSHTSQAGWEPPNVPALWTQIGKPGEIPEWKQPTGAQDAYMRGDKVRHVGKVWESLVDSNVWEPGVYGWSEVA